MKDYFWLTGNDEKACIRLKNVVSLQRINGINDMRQIINYLYLVIVVLMTGCAGCGDTKDEAQTDKEFDQVKSNLVGRCKKKGFIFDGTTVIIPRGTHLDPRTERALRWKGFTIIEN